MARSTFFVAGNLLLLLAVSGCQRGPSAPELRNSPVYSNSREGFRFLVPEGWTQTASADLPTGDLETELFLVRYDSKSPDSDGQIQVLCFQDKSLSADLAARRAKPAFGIDNWTLKEGPTSQTIGGKEGTWLYLTGKTKGRDLGQEVLTFRKGDRVYSFVGTFSAADKATRQTIRTAFESVIWK